MTKSVIHASQPLQRLSTTFTLLFTPIMGTVVKFIIRILGGSRLPLFRASPPILPAGDSLEEEQFAYEDIPDRYYPTYLGDIFHNRYQILLKLGYGTTSTVWLAQDLMRWKKYVAVKILTVDASDKDGQSDELEVLKHVSKAVPPDKTHTGLSFFRKVIDSFEIQGPGGKHLCIVQIPLRQTLSTFMRERANLPLSIYKSILVQTFWALDYLHTVCNVVHTDISGRNLMFETNRAYFDDLLDAEQRDPSPQKETGNRIIYSSRYSCISKQGTFGRLILSDFGSARILDPDKPVGKGDIQPDGYRAPEVIFGANWSYSVDIWNVACLVWGWIEDSPLFIGLDQFNNEGYDPEMHLAEINARIGPPPKDLLTQAERNKDSFDQDGKWIGDITITSDYTLETTEKKLEGEEKEHFLHFMKAMLQWLPDDRLTALRLLEHPWLWLNRSPIVRRK
ncbi:MAG: hypothetical protein Q9187_002573 [Circinaria calcarea]